MGVLQQSRLAPRAIFCLGMSVVHFCYGGPSEDNARLLQHLLNYVAVDYEGAVEKGEIKNQTEYQEQRDFARAAREQAASLSGLSPSARVHLLQKLGALEQKIGQKAPARAVEALARQLSTEVVQLTGLTVAPLTYPSLKHGKALYREKCASCHGARGDGKGPAGGSLNPPPANFQDTAMGRSAPTHFFNSIRLGVPGTGMAPFAALSDKDTWDLAFYVASLHTPETPASSQAPSVSLQEVATKNDEELAKALGGTAGGKRAVAQIRKYESSTGAQTFIQKAKLLLHQSFEQFQAGDRKAAEKKALVAYLEGVEPIEPRLKVRELRLVAAIEQSMAELRSLMAASGAQPSTVEAKCQQVETLLDAAGVALSREEDSPFLTFLVALGIFLREAFEAVLFLIALLGIVGKAEETAGPMRSAKRAIHSGWCLAVALGVACWIFSGWVLQLSGLQRELLEGITSLLAVVVLVLFGLWLHGKAEMDKWRAFIKGSMTRAMGRKSALTLLGISFTAVFREAFETVLFLRAVLLEATSQASKMALLSGVLTAFGLVLVLGFYLVRFSVRLPLKTLFSASSWVMIALAFILAGKAVHSFQEVGLISASSLPLGFQLDWFGIYPTYETIVPQIGVIVLALFLAKRGERGGPRCSKQGRALA